MPGRSTLPSDAVRTPSAELEGQRLGFSILLCSNEATFGTRDGGAGTRDGVSLEDLALAKHELISGKGLLLDKTNPAGFKHGE